ncbi:GTPase IMAP family member 7-like [Engraulis encrasicolus]|uniref:GTPase IMAP family member 7-like n=1 Tax=Engraulis encrasicolus TaxID=184585 RepID=UPI002FD50A7C
MKANDKHCERLKDNVRFLEIQDMREEHLRKTSVRDALKNLEKILKDAEELVKKRENMCRLKQRKPTAWQNSLTTKASDYVMRPVTFPSHYICRSSAKCPHVEAQVTSPPLRIVLVGITGAGKSATGNTILGREAFESTPSCQTVTNRYEQASTTSPREIQVVDTPGVLHTERDPTEVKEEILPCIQLSAPGPHAFLLVITVGRFTDEERRAVTDLQEIFGEKAKDYIIVLFTGVDFLGMSIRKFVEEQDPRLKELIRSCGGRYHGFENKSRDRTQVDELLRKIDEMVAANGGQHYVY